MPIERAGQSVRSTPSNDPCPCVRVEPSHGPTSPHALTKRTIVIVRSSPRVHEGRLDAIADAESQLCSTTSASDLRDRHVSARIAHRS